MSGVKAVRGIVGWVVLWLGLCGAAGAQGLPANHALGVSRGPTVSGWTSLGPATTGQVVVSKGTGADPIFTTGATPNEFGDLYFGSGRPWCDVVAKGAGVNNLAVDSSAAFASCVSTLGGGGGVIFVPRGNYCLYSGVTIGAYTRLVGASNASTALDACGHDTTVVTLNGSYAGLEDVRVNGLGAGLTDIVGASGITATQPAILLASGSGARLVRRVAAQGGNIVLKNQGNDSYIEDSAFDLSYGTSVYYNSGNGTRWIAGTVDHNWPQAYPGPGTLAAISARANATGYGLGAVVSLTGWYLQATVAGTSGGSAPALLNYNNDIIDGTVTWRLVSKVGLAGMELTSTGGEVAVSGGVDITCGGCTYGVLADGSGTAHSFTQVTVGQTILSAMEGTSGSGLIVHNSHVAGGVIQGTAAIRFSGTYTGGSSVVGTEFLSGDLGIDVAAGNDYAFSSNIMNSLVVTTGVKIAANLSNISVNDNIFGVITTGVSIAAGTGDYLTVLGNGWNGTVTPVANSATGSHNIMANGSTVKIPGPKGTSAIRQTLSGSLDMYVNGDSGSTHPCKNGTLTCGVGSDSNTCLTSAAPCLTLSHVINDLIYDTYDFAGQAINIWLAENTGTTNYAVFCASGGFVGAITLNVRGNVNDPELTVITAPNSNYGIFVKDGCSLSLFDLALADQGSAAGGVHADNGAFGGGVDMRSVDFGKGTWGANTALVSATSGGIVNIIGPSSGSAFTNQISSSTSIGEIFGIQNGGEILVALDIDIPNGFVINAAQWGVVNNGGILAGVTASTFTGAGRALVTGRKCLSYGGYMGTADPNSLFPGDTACAQVNVISATIAATGFANLPTCSSTIRGAMRWVSDSNTAAWGATIAAGGANNVLGICGGTNWKVISLGP